MSLGNLKTQGAKGTNYPYQARVVKALSQIVTLLGGGGSTTTVQKETSLIRTTAGPDTVSGAYAASFSNTGTANARVNLIDVRPGETINFDGGNFILKDIVYDASVNPGAELLIAIVK